MNRRLTQKVTPQSAVIIILIVLVTVQVIWWRGLVVQEKPTVGGMGGGPPAPAEIPSLRGRKDVQVDTVAGTPEPGSADGMGRNARFDGPTGLAIDPQGNLYIADTRNHRIRKMAPDGEVTTLAGGVPGNADGTAAQAQFNLPCAVTVGEEGALYVADTGNNRIRRIHNGQVTTLAGDATRLHQPCAVAFVPGNVPALLVGDSQQKRVQTLSLAGAMVREQPVPGVPTGFATSPEQAVAIPGFGLRIGARTLRSIPMDTQQMASNPGGFVMNKPLSLCHAPAGWFALDAFHNGVFLLHEKTAELIAGVCEARTRRAAWIDGTGEHALFGTPCGIVYDGQGHLYVSDTANNSIRRITLPQELTGGMEAHP